MTTPRPAPSVRLRPETVPLRIAMLGTRGVPADDGIEAVIAEVGERLAARGHHVTVYCETEDDRRSTESRGMRLVHLPAIGAGGARTASRAALASAHLVMHRRHDVAVVFGTGNSVFVPMLRSRGIATAVHVDGLEWRDPERSRRGRRYIRFAEQMAVREADVLVTGSRTVGEYFRDEFHVPTDVIAAGTELLDEVDVDRLDALGVGPGRFHLANPATLIDTEIMLEAHRRSATGLPLVVAGHGGQHRAIAHLVARAATRDPRVRGVDVDADHEQLTQLSAHALTSIHGRSIGAFNARLLTAMGAGTAVLANDDVFTREVAGRHARYFENAENLTALLEDAERHPLETHDAGASLRVRATERHDWENAASAYEALAMNLVRGYSIRGMSDGRRRGSEWSTPEGAERAVQHA